MRHRQPPTRRWISVTVVVLVLLGAAAVIYSLWFRSSTEQPQLSQQLPAPSPVAPVSASQVPTPTATPEPIVESPIVIEPSAPVGIFIPSDDPDLVISTEVKPMEPCQELIDPPRGSGVGDIYYCTDFAMPGTDSEGKTVIAGHASQKVDTWLNRLQVQGDSMLGRQILLQTASSDQRWLEYIVTGVYQPAKEELPYMTEVWGAPGESTSGRVVVVTCLIDGSGTITHNYVVVAELIGVKG